jgi:hypothetical protein
LSTADAVSTHLSWVETASGGRVPRTAYELVCRGGWYELVSVLFCNELAFSGQCSHRPYIDRAILWA